MFRRRRGLESMPGIPPPIPSRRYPSDWLPVSDLYPECPAPHCDAAVLHAPGQCKYCDNYPIYQQYRQLAGIAFTGCGPTGDEVMCPSEVRRGLRHIEAWGGNRKSGE